MINVNQAHLLRLQTPDQLLPHLDLLALFLQVLHEEVVVESGFAAELFLTVTAVERLEVGVGPLVPLQQYCQM